MFLLKKNSLKQREISQSLENMKFDEDDTYDYVIADVVNNIVFELDENNKIGDLYY